ncbi:MAG: hypothetical protein HY821_06910 [Acidobacteria bacterium]|nr:hypothetical protein [Acidobacteriota bacterium]
MPEQEIRQNGTGPAVEIPAAASTAFTVTLGINRILEQESLDVCIKGSADGEVWGDKPLAAFPQKFYCGVYSLYLDLSDAPETKYLRVEWKMNRWGRGEPTPLFGIYVFAEPVLEGALRAAV